MYVFGRPKINVQVWRKEYLQDKLPFGAEISWESPSGVWKPGVLTLATFLHTILALSGKILVLECPGDTDIDWSGSGETEVDWFCCGDSVVDWLCSGENDVDWFCIGDNEVDWFCSGDSEVDGFCSRGTEVECSGDTRGLEDTDWSEDSIMLEDTGCSLDNCKLEDIGCRLGLLNRAGMVRTFLAQDLICERLRRNWWIYKKNFVIFSFLHPSIIFKFYIDRFL